MSPESPLHTSTFTDKGFTLIELMVAITLLIIVVSIVSASFSSVASSIEQVRALNSDNQLRNFLIQNIRGNLVQAYDPWLPGAANRNAYLPSGDPDTLDQHYWLFGEDIEGPDGPADKLVFATTAALLGNAGLPGTLKQVTYQISYPIDDEHEETADSFSQNVLTTPSTIVLIEEAIPDRMPPPPEQGQNGRRTDPAPGPAAEPTWSAPVHTLNIRYFDGEEWFDEWDSVGRQQLPWSIEFRINFAKTDEAIEAERRQDYRQDDDPDFLLVVTLPAGMGLRDAPPTYTPAGSNGSNQLGSPIPAGFQGVDAEELLKLIQ